MACINFTRDMFRDYTHKLNPKNYDKFLPTMTIYEKSSWLSNNIGCIVVIDGKYFILVDVSGSYITIKHDSSLLQSNITRILDAYWPEKKRVSDIDWTKVESFEFSGKILIPESITKIDNSDFFELVCYGGIRLRPTDLVTNIKYKKDERSIKVPRRNSKVKRNSRIRGVAISSRTSRAKCKRGNF